MSKRSDWFEKNNAQEGVRLGMVSSAVFMDYVRYVEFMNNLNQGMDRGKAIIKAAKYLNVHRTTVLRAVTFFEDVQEHAHR